MHVLPRCKSQVPEVQLLSQRCPAGTCRMEIPPRVAALESQHLPTALLRPLVTSKRLADS